MPKPKIKPFINKEIIENEVNKYCKIYNECGFREKGICGKTFICAKQSYKMTKHQ